MTEKSLLEEAVEDYDSRHENEEILTKDKLSQEDFNSCTCEDKIVQFDNTERSYIHNKYDVLLPEMVNNLINDLTKAEQEWKTAEIEHQHMKALLWTDAETIEKVQTELGITKQPTQKQIESYIRLETKDLEIERYEAENHYKHLLRIYEKS